MVPRRVVAWANGEAQYLVDYRLIFGFGDVGSWSSRLVPDLDYLDTYYRRRKAGIPRGAKSASSSVVSSASSPFCRIQWKPGKKIWGGTGSGVSGFFERRACRLSGS